MNSKNAGKLISHINLLNGRLFNKLLSKENAIFSGEQGKILNSLWEKQPKTLTDISIETCLAKNTLTSMLERLEKQELIYSYAHPIDKRKTLFELTELGLKQCEIGVKVSKELSEIFYKNISEEEIDFFEKVLEKIKNNLMEN